MAPAASTPDHVDATLDYLAPDSTVNRFFWAPEGRASTVRSVPAPVRVRNARTADHDFTPDDHGFALTHWPTAVTDFLDQSAIDGVYAREVEAIAKALTGADLVVPMGAQVRFSAGHGGPVQPPAAKVHIDYDTRTARQIAARRYRKARPEGRGYARFILFSLWRTFSPGPQDWPLALCDFESAKDDAEMRCVKIDVPALPQGDACFAPIEGEESMGASSLFMHNPAHRWWFYPCMTADEAVFIKFHDSDRSRAWRALHTAFHDETTPGTHPRESIEFRGCAYFTQG